MTQEMLDPAALFSSKAETYDRFRWDYAPSAIEYILDRTGVNSGYLMADIGAGTGILTRHFLDSVKAVYAVEPNKSMRDVAEYRHGAHPAFRRITRGAESTGLPDQSLDLVVVGQALHWFDLEYAPDEISRILKPDGWLVVIWNKLGREELTQELEGMFSRYMGDERRRTDPELLPPYFRGSDFRQLSFGVVRHSNWDQFIGGLLSASWAPAENDSSYRHFREEARGFFERSSTGGELTIKVVTHVAIGRPNAKQRAMP